MNRREFLKSSSILLGSTFISGEMLLSAKANTAGPYLDLTVDPFDKNGLSQVEIDALESTGYWKKVKVKDDTVEVDVQFRKPDSIFYTKTGRLTLGTEILVNEDIGIGVLAICRNNIESDWRTLQRIYK